MTTRYLLDTDTCAFLLRRTSSALIERMQAIPLALQCISAVTLAELLYGVQLSSKKAANQAAVDALVAHLEVLPWTAPAAEHYAAIRADLKKQGQLIGSNDLLIAAHARSLDATLVTNNVREFKRVKRLKVENWMN